MVQDEKGQTVAGATVTASGTGWTPNLEAKANNQGVAALQLPPDVYTILAKASGYQERSGTKKTF